VKAGQFAGTDGARGISVDRACGKEARIKCGIRLAYELSDGSLLYLDVVF
jgi:hypothetical protein